MKDKVIGVSKNPWEHRIRKGQGCPRKVNGSKMPKGKWDIGTRKQCNQNAQVTILSYLEKNKQQAQRGLAGLGQIII